MKKFILSLLLLNSIGILFAGKKKKKNGSSNNTIEEQLDEVMKNTDIDKRYNAFLSLIKTQDKGVFVNDLKEEGYTKKVSTPQDSFKKDLEYNSSTKKMTTVANFLKKLGFIINRVNDKDRYEVRFHITHPNTNNNFIYLTCNYVGDLKMEVSVYSSTAFLPEYIKGNPLLFAALEKYWKEEHPNDENRF